MKLHLPPLLSLLCASLLAGCTTPSHLIFHQSTSLGVDASANAGTRPGPGPDRPHRASLKNPAMHRHSRLLLAAFGLTACAPRALDFHETTKVAFAAADNTSDSSLAKS